MFVNENTRQKKKIKIKKKKIKKKTNTNTSKECHICHYWCFEDIGFKHEPYLCNGCHGLIQKAMNFNDVAIVYVEQNVYRIHFWYMSKDDATSMTNNSNLDEKMGGLYFFCNKVSKFNSIEGNFVEKTYYQENRDVILNGVKNYYKDYNERLKNQARDKYRNLSEEEKDNIKRKYGRSRYHNMSEEEKQRIKEYQKNYRKV